MNDNFCDELYDIVWTHNNVCLERERDRKVKQEKRRRVTYRY